MKAPARRAWLAAVVLVVLLAWAASARADETTYPELPNFHRVDDHLFRGGQPGTGGVARLKELGVRTIVNLRRDHDSVTAEQAEAEVAGIRYYSVPMHGLGKPTDEQIWQVLDLFAQQDNWPIFVHCKAGSDRTGLVVACRRVTQAGWTAERAIREAMDHGMMRIEFGMRAFIRDFSARLRGAGAPAGDAP